MRGYITLAVCLLCGSLGAIIVGDEDILKRGDANHSGAVNIGDAVFISNYLFHGGPAPPCENEADANHDGQISGADASYILNWLFSGGPAPPAPGPFNTSCTDSSNPIIGCSSGC